MAGASGEWTEHRINHLTPGLGRFQRGHHSQTAVVMSMKVDRHGNRLLERSDQIKGGSGINEAGHILDRDLMHSLVFELPSFRNKLFYGVNRTDRIADRSLRNFSSVSDRLDNGLVVASIVQGIKYAEHIYPVAGRRVHEFDNHVVRKIGVRYQVLSSNEHHALHVGHGRFESPGSLPRVFPEIPNAYVEGRPAPSFRSINPAIGKFRSDLEQVFQLDAGGHFAL